MRNLPSETLWIPLWTLSDLWYSWTLWERKWRSWIPSICICLSVDSMIFLRSSEVTFFVTEHFPKCVMNQTLIDPCSLNKSECQLTLIVIPLIEYLTFTFKLSPYTWDSHICCSRICKVLSLSSIRTMYYFFNLLKFLRLLSVLVWKCNYVKGYTYEIY